MKINIYPLKRDTIESFADEHGLVMEVHERDQRHGWHSPNARWYAHFSGCEIMERGMLVSASGNGSTPDEAIASYADAISGKRIVFGAYTAGRKEIDVPVLHKEPA